MFCNGVYCSQTCCHVARSFCSRATTERPPCPPARVLRAKGPSSQGSSEQGLVASPAAPARIHATLALPSWLDQGNSAWNTTPWDDMTAGQACRQAPSWRPPGVPLGTPWHPPGIPLSELRLPLTLPPPATIRPRSPASSIAGAVSPWWRPDPVCLCEIPDFKRDS